MSNLRRLVECFECERYYPFKGWSKSLLSTDRDSFGDRNGDWGYSTLAEYSDAVLTPGWFWEQGDWQVARNDRNVDAEGWSYCVDFSGFSAAIPSPVNSSADAADAKDKEREKDRTVKRGSVIIVQDDVNGAIDPYQQTPVTTMKTDTSSGAGRDEWQGGDADADEEIQTLQEQKPALGEEPEQSNSSAVGKSSPPSKPLTFSTSGFGAEVGRTAEDPYSYTSTGSSAKTMLHFSRRRRLLRWQCFNDALITSGIPLSRLPCSYCDLEALREASAMLLQALTEASLIAHPRIFSEPKCNALKVKLVQALKLDCTTAEWVQMLSQSPPSPARTPCGAEENENACTASDSSGSAAVAQTESSPIPPAGIDAPSVAAPPALPVVKTSSKLSTPTASAIAKVTEPSSPTDQGLRALLEKLLSPFKAACSSAGSTVSGLFSSSSAEVQERRSRFIADACFPATERRILALAVIKVHDVPAAVASPVDANLRAGRRGAGYNYHCQVVGCMSCADPPCVFAHEVCRNEGCTSEYSACRRQEHRDVCPFELLACPRTECIERVARRSLDMHVAQSCPHRPAVCPFKELGCDAALTACTVASHMESAHAAHSLLMLQRMNEQQGVIKGLHKQVNETRTELVAAAATLTGVLATIEVMQAREGKDAMHEIGKVKKQVGDKLKDVENALGTRLQNVATQLSSNIENERIRVNTEFNKVAKALQALR